MDADRARQLFHGASFAAASAIVAAVIGRIAGRQPWPAAAITLLSLWLHDLADVFQGAPGSQWWPLPFLEPVPEVIPDTLIGEIAVIGPVAVAIVIAIAAGRRARAPGDPDAELRAVLPVGVAAWTILPALLALAITTNVLRHAQHVHVAAAAASIEDRRYAEALHQIGLADGWPNVVKPGRLDYLRAESYAGLGDDARAEDSYQRARRADPGYFWATADLAVLYAGSRGSVEERRAKIAPLVAILEKRFHAHAALPRTLSRIEQRLAHPARRGS